MFKPVFIEANDLNDAYFTLLWKLWNNGRKYKIDTGSFAGSYRLEFDYVSGFIKYPHTRPLSPIMPPNVSPVTTEEKIELYFANYLMDANLEPHEHYRYSSWLNSTEHYGEFGANGRVLYGKYIEETPIEWVIKHFKEKGYGNNHCYINIGNVDSGFNYDIPYTNETERGTSPCFRGIDFKIKDNQLITSVVFRSWDLYCIDEKSEILTDNGWKNINTISKNDKAATLNLNKWETEYCDIEYITKSQYKGKMYKIKTKRIDQLITPNHRVLHKYVTHSGNIRIIKNYEYTQVKYLVPKDGIFIPIASTYNGGTWELGHYKASLIGWILTDAFYRKDCDAIEIFQSEKKYHDEIRTILVNLGIKFTENKKERTVYKIANKDYPDGYDKVDYTFYIGVKETKWIKDIIPERLPTNKLLNLIKKDRQSLFNAMIMADGSIKSDNNCCFYSMNKEKLQWFQLLALSLGYSTTINENEGTIGISTKKESLIQRNHFNNMTNTIDYDGLVWCITTKNSNFIMRRNNKISITGNSGFPENMGGFTLLNEYICDQLGDVEPGSLAFTSAGLHAYDYQLKPMMMILNKDNFHGDNFSDIELKIKITPCK